MFGMSRSMSTTSGWSRRARATPSEPSAASPTTSMSSWRSKNVRRPIRTTAWSSTSRTRIGVVSLTAPSSSVAAPVPRPSLASAGAAVTADSPAEPPAAGSAGAGGMAPGWPAWPAMARRQRAGAGGREDGLLERDGIGAAVHARVGSGREREGARARPRGTWRRCAGRPTGRAQCADEPEAGREVGQVRVDDHDARLETIDRIERLAELARGSDDLDAVGQADQVGEAVADAMVAVDDEDALRVRRAVPDGGRGTWVRAGRAGGGGWAGESSSESLRPPRRRADADPGGRRIRTNVHTR